MNVKLVAIVIVAAVQIGVTVLAAISALAVGLTTLGGGVAMLPAAGGLGSIVVEASGVWGALRRRSSRNVWLLLGSAIGTLLAVLPALLIGGSWWYVFALEVVASALLVLLAWRG